MDNPETSEERRSRLLRELEGKNVEHYSVLLQTVIESELEGIKQIIALSSVGIGLQFALDRFPAGSSLLPIAVILSVVSVVAMAVAIFCGVRFFLAASKRYEGEIRGTDDEPSYRNLLEARDTFAHWRRASVTAFLVGVFALAGFVVVAGAGALAKPPKETAQPKTTSVAPTSTNTVSKP